MDSNKKFIAKKVREDSNELEMLRLLDTFPLKSDHVISLIDSFHDWIILPKMVTVKGYVEFAPDLSESEVSQICLGLIKGVAYLHEHLIAHRDIKPDNLLLDNKFCLKIIDFDIAMRVEDEDEEVDDQCGTKNWMAPEVEKRLRHSPIKADRWACGRVLLFLLDKFGTEDESLKGFARNLMADNPKHRPSLLEWYVMIGSTVLERWNRMEFQHNEGIAASTGPSGSRRRRKKHEAPECEEAETRWVAGQYPMYGF
jgi:serine/threonine protein kinase